MLNLLGNASETSNDPIEQLAKKKGHSIYNVPLKENKSFSIEAPDSTCSIFISNSVSRKERRTCLAHELGHCEYGGFYDQNTSYELQSRIEYRADKWAFLKLAPPGKVKEAIRAGCCELWQFSEWFDITDEYMAKILAYYSQQALI